MVTEPADGCNANWGAHPIYLTGIIHVTWGMRMEDRNAEGFSVSEKLPLPFERVMLVCAVSEFRGYIDARNAWHYDTNDAKITGKVLAWMPCLTTPATASPEPPESSG